MSCKPALLAVISLCCVTATQAASQLPPILVSAARSELPGLDIPAATRVIDAAQIADSGAHDLAELLRNLPGLHVSDAIGDGGNASIDMRGFGATAQSNVAVLLNGRKLNPATDSASLYLNSIDLDQVVRIEVIEGSAGTLYGNQAVGGLVNIITRRPDTRRREVRVGAGSYDAWEISVGASEPLNQQLAVQFQAQQRASDNYRDHNASRLSRFDGRLELQHTDGYSYLDLQHLDDFVETPGALFAAELAANRRQAVFPNDFLDTRSQVLRIGSEHRLGDHWQLAGELAVRNDHRDFIQSFRGFPGSLSTQDRDTLELTPRLVGDYDGRVITLGIDAQHTDYLLISAFGPQGNEQTIVAAYAQLTQPLSAALSLTAGVRHARVDNDIDNNGSPVQLDDSVSVGSLGLVYRPDGRWRLFARADQNYRFAKVDEHTNVPFGQPAGLNNQRGISYESGAEFHGAGVALALRLYQLDLTDEISFDAGTFTNVNLPSSRRRGFNLSADTDLGRQLRLGAGYAYVDSEITSGSHAGKRVPLVPEHRANAYLAYRPHNAWQLRLDVEHVGRQFLGADFSNGASPLGAYTVANLVAHHDVGDWRLTAKVNNLFNELYSESGASSFAGDGFNPAAERELWIGASYHFEE